MSAKSFTTAAVAVLLVLVSGQALQVRAQNERWSIFCTDPIGSSAQEVTFVRAAWSAGNNNYRSEGASVSNSNPLNVAPPDCACLDISGLNTGLELSSFVAEINGDDEITGLQGSGSDFEIQPFNGLNPRIPFQGSADGDTLSGYVHFNYPFFPCCDDEADECCDDGGHARDQDTPCTGATGGSGTCNLGVCEVVEPSGDGSSGDGDDDGLNGGGGGLFGGGGPGGALVFAGIGVAVLVVVAVVVAVVCCCRGAGSGYKSSGDVEFVDSSTLTATEALKAEHGTERRPQRIVSHREPPKPPSSESGDNGGDFDPTMI